MAETPAGANPYAELDDDDLLAQCRVETMRGSGPGGQHRNKVESAVRLTHEPTGIVVTASERRSQHRNRELALERLREKLADRFRVVRPRRPTRKSKGLRKREVEAKRRQGEKKRLRRTPADHD